MGSSRSRRRSARGSREFGRPSPGQCSDLQTQWWRRGARHPRTIFRLCGALCHAHRRQRRFHRCEPLPKLFFSPQTSARRRFGPRRGVSRLCLVIGVEVRRAGQQAAFVDPRGRGPWLNPGCEFGVGFKPAVPFPDGSIDNGAFKQLPASPTRNQPNPVSQARA